MQPQRASAEKPAVLTDSGGEYVLSEVRNAALATALETLADLAPTLRERELRVLIALTKELAAQPQQSGKISLKQLAAASGLAKSNVQLAIRELRARHAIAARGATATTAAGYALTYTRIRKMGVPNPGTPPTAELWKKGYLEQAPVPNLGTPPDLKQVQGVLIPGTPPTDQERTEGPARARVDFDSISIENIDRVIKADPKTCDPSEIREVKRWIHGYSLKFGKDNQGRPAHPHPPDDTIAAQLLAIAPCTRIIALIQDLMVERLEPGQQYGWYVAVAAQRIAGIKPAELKARRAELRIVRTVRRPPAPAAEETPAQDFTREILHQITKGKAL